MKDAIGAIEAVANIVAGTRGIQLNRLIYREPLKSGIPLNIGQSIDKIYAYRGSSPGVAHGQVGPSVVGIAEANWVLAVASATIIYLAQKYPE